MKNIKIISVLSVLMFHTQAFSQNIPNPSFESWDTISRSSQGQSEWYTIPTGWSKISGSTSKRSIEDGYFDDVYDGNNSMVFFNADTRTVPTVATSTFSFNKRPHHFSFWSKTLSYDSKPFTVEVLLFKESGTIISKSTFTAGTRYYTINEDLVNKFQETFIVLDYIESENPDSARITFKSSLPENYPSGSLLFLDSLSFSSYSVGVEEYASESLNQYWTITPNPVSSNLMYIDYSDARIVDNATIQITDMFGKLLFESSTGELIKTDGRMIINTSDLGSGTYNVTIVSEHHRETKKIVVIH
jgi:hypothetical protein